LERPFGIGHLTACGGEGLHPLPRQAEQSAELRLVAPLGQMRANLRP
jgi:hypothetical protein